MSLVGTLLLQIGEVGQKLVQKRKSEQFLLTPTEEGKPDLLVSALDEEKDIDAREERGGAKAKQSLDDTGMS